MWMWLEQGRRRSGEARCDADGGEAEKGASHKDKAVVVNYHGTLCKDLGGNQFFRF